MEQPLSSPSPSMSSDAGLTLFRIGIDVGGTKIESILLTPSGQEVYRRRLPSPAAAGYEAVLSAICEHAGEALEKVPWGADCTVGIGIPGSIHEQSSLVQNANSTCLIGHPLQRDLESRLGRCIGIDNDANCFTLAEALAGAGRGFGLVFGVIMGTGCGGGICLDGSIRQGPNRIAGEWGHIAVDPGGAACYCGKRGCVETKISGSGVERSFASTYGERRSMTEIVAGYRQGDTRCTAAFRQFLMDFGRCLGGLISVLDPDVVVLGGGLSHIDELYTEGVEQVRRHAFHSQIRTPVLRNSLGDSAGVIGAAWIGR